jgi:hypothetical protein
LKADGTKVDTYIFQNNLKLLLFIRFILSLFYLKSSNTDHQLRNSIISINSNRQFDNKDGGVSGLLYPPSAHPVIRAYYVSGGDGGDFLSL